MASYDWSEAVSGLKLPVLIVVGDADSVRTAHAVEFVELLAAPAMASPKRNLELPE